jgi:hypothetical protein
MNAPLTPAHSPFGGSVAARVLHCPASVGLVEKVPTYLRKTSRYAERGTAHHSAMALLIEEKRCIDDLVGETFNNYALTIDDIEAALRPAYAYVSPLLDAPGAEYYLERRVTFPAVAGAFGTADLVVRIGRTIHVVDFKFGAGVRVLALYPDGDEDVLNAQLLFYAAAARYSLPDFFAGVKDIILTIVQPQSIEPDAEMVATVTVAPAELDEFVSAYRTACAEALAPAPRLERGPHCRFCPAKPICPAHAGPLLDLAQFADPTPPQKPRSLFQFLTWAGGLKPHPDLAVILDGKHAWMIRRSGLSLDAAREACVQEGFLADHEEREREPSINDLLELIAAEASGHKQYRAHEAVDAYEYETKRAAYLQLLADGLSLADAVKDLRTALHDQAKRALERGDVVPGYALTAGRAERHWRGDESAAIAALEGLGLTQDDIVAETLRSPKQVEIRAKARGLKIPSEFIVSTRSGTSLVRVENSRAPMPGRSEITRSFSEALEAFLEVGTK